MLRVVDPAFFAKKSHAESKFPSPGSSRIEMKPLPIGHIHRTVQSTDKNMPQAACDCVRFPVL
jgi:hypothetical protein